MKKWSKAILTQWAIGAICVCLITIITLYSATINKKAKEPIIESAIQTEVVVIPGPVKLRCKLYMPDGTKVTEVYDVKMGRYSFGSIEDILEYDPNEGGWRLKNPNLLKNKETQNEEVD